MNSADQMLLLLKKIEDHHASYPETKDVNLLEGELSEMRSLLYTLKGRGVIGLFNEVEVPVSKENKELEDTGYMFNIDWSAFEKFKKKFLGSKNKDLPLKYNPKTGTGLLRGKKFTFRINNRKAKVFAKLYDQIGEPIKREDVLTLAEYNHKNTPEVFISELVKDIRKATSLSTEELVLNNDLTLVLPLE